MWLHSAILGNAAIDLPSALMGASALRSQGVFGYWEGSGPVKRRKRDSSLFWPRVGIGFRDKRIALQGEAVSLPCGLEGPLLLKSSEEKSTKA